MSVSPGTVKTHLFRARAKIQVKLRGREFDEGDVIMNCAEIASTLQETLLHQRDSRWVREARRHAERCPGCARLLELHKVEESLAGLLGIEPASDLVESVMSRVMQPQPVVFSPLRQLLVGTFKNAAMFVGALVLATRLPCSGSRSILALESLAVGSIPSVAHSLGVSLAASPVGNRSRRICRPADPHGPGPARPSGAGKNLAGSLSPAMRYQLADRPERFAEIAIKLLVDHVRLVVERLDLGVDRGRFNRMDGGVASFGNGAKGAGSHLG